MDISEKVKIITEAFNNQHDQAIYSTIADLFEDKFNSLEYHMFMPIADLFEMLNWRVRRIQKGHIKLAMNLENYAAIRSRYTNVLKSLGRSHRDLYLDSELTDEKKDEYEALVFILISQINRANSSIKLIFENVRLPEGHTLEHYYDEIYECLDTMSCVELCIKAIQRDISIRHGR